MTTAQEVQFIQQLSIEIANQLANEFYDKQIIEIFFRSNPDEQSFAE